MTFIQIDYSYKNSIKIQKIHCKLVLKLFFSKVFAFKIIKKNTSISL